MDFDKKDYYGVLGVSPNAEDFLIKAAYKALAQRYHPDKDKANHSGDKFKAINEAYSILSDVNKRQQYDDYLKKKNSNPLNQNQAQPEEQNTNDINQNNEELVASITILILTAVLTIASVFAVLFVSVISSARNLYQKFIAYSDENARRAQYEAELKRKQHEEELKRKQREENLKSKQREEELKRKKDDGNLKSKQCEEELKRKEGIKPESRNDGLAWGIVVIFFVIKHFWLDNKEMTHPEITRSTAVATNEPPPVSSEPVSSEPQPVSVEPATVPDNQANDCISGDCFNGSGIRKYQYGEYRGEFKNGLPDGFGTAFYGNGHEIVGTWKNGTLVANQPEYKSTPVIPEARKQTSEEASYKKQQRAEAKKQAKAEAKERREQAKAEARLINSHPAFDQAREELKNQEAREEQAETDLGEQVESQERVFNDSPFPSN